MFIFENLNFINHHIFIDAQYCILEYYMPEIEQNISLIFLGGVEVDEFGNQLFEVTSDFMREGDIVENYSLILDISQIDEVLLEFYNNFGDPVNMNRIKI